MRPAPSSSNGQVTQLAAACGDGSVKLYAVAAHAAGAEYERSLPRVEGNVLALAWHPDGRSLVSGGSDGCIHCWDVQRGERQSRFKAYAVTQFLWVRAGGCAILKQGSVWPNVGKALVCA
jgi:WD40 repeat protein